MATCFLFADIKYLISLIMMKYNLFIDQRVIAKSIKDFYCQFLKRIIVNVYYLYTKECQYPVKLRVKFLY